jgi:hypothetical protein
MGLARWLFAPYKRSADSRMGVGSEERFDSRTYSVNDFVEWDKQRQLELNPAFQRRAAIPHLRRIRLSRRGYRWRRAAAPHKDKTVAAACERVERSSLGTRTNPKDRTAVSSATIKGRTE